MLILCSSVSTSVPVSISTSGRISVGVSTSVNISISTLMLILSCTDKAQTNDNYSDESVILLYIHPLCNYNPFRTLLSRSFIPPADEHILLFILSFLYIAILVLGNNYNYTLYSSNILTLASFRIQASSLPRAQQNIKNKNERLLLIFKF